MYRSSSILVFKKKKRYFFAKILRDLKPCAKLEEEKKI